MKTHASLFSGIGGFDLAAEWMGWRNVFHVERDPFCQKVLSHHFPQSQSFQDVKTFDGRPWQGQVDVLSGGFPCQPYSTAGKRLGKNDDRHLWPEMCRIISEIAPTYVVGENVRGLTSWNEGLVFEEVCADLEAQGYEVWAGVLPAAGINAPHRRERVFFVAKNTLRGGRLHGGSNQEGADFRQQRDFGSRGADGLHLSTGNASYSDSPRRQEHDVPSKSSESKLLGGHNDVFAPSDAKIDGLQHAKKPGSLGACQSEARQFIGGQLASEGWSRFPTQSPIRGRNDGVSTELDGIAFSKWRNESIKAYGNAVVPQLVYTIFQAIEQSEEVQQSN